MRDFPSKFEPIGKYFIGYDNACQLKPFCDNQAVRYPNSPIPAAISKIRKVHDRLHIRNHNELCKKGELNPDKYEELNGVNTQVAEQFFSHLLKFVFTFRNTSSIRAQIWILLIIHQWNLKKEVKLNNTIPTKQQILKVSMLKDVNVFKTWHVSVSKKSKKRINMISDKLKLKLLKPWGGSKLKVNIQAKKQKFKRKRQ